MSLTPEQVSRYRRQIILPDFRATGQEKLLSTSFLIVGCGGLGSPALLYLAGAGVGKIGLVDGDLVEVSNLHRQIAHKETTLGQPKVVSAAATIKALNSSVEVVIHEQFLSSANALAIFSQYDIVLDCTDNVATRYLINDACILSRKPLVSASALRFDGQLTIYGFEGGPCYRCLYPTPPPLDTIGSCADQGVLGVVTGIMGGIQALEAIKLALLLKKDKLAENTSSHAGSVEVLSGKLLVFNALGNLYKVVKLRTRSKDCAICGDNPSIKNLIQDYQLFCSPAPPTSQLKPTNTQSNPSGLALEDEVTVLDLAEVRKGTESYILLDVRRPEELEICALRPFLNIPLHELPAKLDVLKAEIQSKQPKNVYVFCRKGNRSVRGVQILKENGFQNVKNVIGGSFEWTKLVDPSFPTY